MNVESGNSEAKKKKKKKKKKIPWFGEGQRKPGKGILCITKYCRGEVLLKKDGFEPVVSCGKPHNSN